MNIIGNIGNIGALGPLKAMGYARCFLVLWRPLLVRYFFVVWLLFSVFFSLLYDVIW